MNLHDHIDSNSDTVAHKTGDKIVLRAISQALH